jgi:hypothetical protein
MTMTYELSCTECNGTFRDDTVEGVLKRAAAHSHNHHGGPAEITPQIEQALLGRVRPV